MCDSQTGALVAGHVPAGLAPGRDITRTTRTGATEANDATEATDATGAQACSTYRIPAAMVRFVRLRDGGCRFPGCSTPARQCDLDHVRPWPTGPTATTNLICLCRRHHRIKQRDGWTVRLHPDATVTWTDPTGRTSTTMPVDHLHLAATTRTPDSASRTDVDSVAHAGSVADPVADSDVRRNLSDPTVTVPPAGAPVRRHIDLSLLDEDLFELLTDHHAPAARRRHDHSGPGRNVTFAAHDSTDRMPFDPDWVWPQRAYEPPPPREPRPDVIPF